MKVTRMHKTDGGGSLKAFVEIVVNDIAIKNLRIYENKNKKKLFVSMPASKGKNGKWYDDVRPITKEARQKLNDVVLKAYEQTYDQKEEKKEEKENELVNAS